MLPRFAFTALLFVAFIAPTMAEEGAGCESFTALERTWFAVPDKPSVAAGTTIAAMPESSFVVRLQPNGTASFALPPEHKPKIDSWFGGTVSLPAVQKAGIYQVTLSDEAWIDVVQNGRFLKAIAHTGRRDCPGLRKSVRFELSQALFIVQLSGAVSDKIAVAVNKID